MKGDRQETKGDSREEEGRRRERKGGDVRRRETKDVRTKYIAKSLRSTISEKRMIDGYDTLPIGF